MAVYVDNVRFRYRNMIMCHLWADTLPELHAMAGKLGLNRAWFQAPPRASWRHYDICRTKRSKAISLGVIETDRFGALEHVARLQQDEAMLARIAEARARRGARPSQGTI